MISLCLPDYFHPVVYRVRVWAAALFWLAVVSDTAYQTILLRTTAQDVCFQVLNPISFACICYFPGLKWWFWIGCNFLLTTTWALNKSCYFEIPVMSMHQHLFAILTQKWDRNNLNFTAPLQFAFLSSKAVSLSPPVFSVINLPLFRAEHINSKPVIYVLFLIVLLSVLAACSSSWSPGEAHSQSKNPLPMLLQSTVPHGFWYGAARGTCPLCTFSYSTAPAATILSHCSSSVIAPL